MYIYANSMAKGWWFGISRDPRDSKSDCTRSLFCAWKPLSAPSFCDVFGGRSQCQTFLQLFRVWKGLVSSYSWGLKCWFPMEIRQIMPQTIDDQPQAVRFHRRFDFNDAMHHRMLRTMYCKLARCKAGIAVFNARCDFVCLSCCVFQVLMLVSLDFHFSFLQFLDSQVLRPGCFLHSFVLPVGTWGMPSCRKSLGGQTGMVGSSTKRGHLEQFVHWFITLLETNISPFQSSPLQTQVFITLETNQKPHQKLHFWVDAFSWKPRWDMLVSWRIHHYMLLQIWFSTIHHRLL